MKRISLVLVFILLCCLCGSALAAFPDQLQGYQAKQKTWQYMEFGAYPTDEDGTVRPILWRVLSADGKQAYMVSEYILFAHRVDPNCYPINKSTSMYGGWDTSELFNELNGDFVKTAFTEAERGALVTMADGGTVSLLDAQDVKNKKLGFTAEKLRQAQSTAYAKANGLFVYQGAKQYSPYWLRTRSESKDYAQRKVQDDGKLGYISVEVADVGVRPVITLDLSKFMNLEGAGTQADPFSVALPAANDATDTEATDETEPGEETPGEAAAGDETEAGEPAENEAGAAEPAADSGVRYATEYAAIFPALTDEGFLPAGEPEFIYEDENYGLWLYASQDIRVEIVRKERQVTRNRPWRWFEADLFVRPGSDEFLRVYYHDQNPKGKKSVEIDEIAYENHLVFSMNADWYYYRVLRNAKRKVMPVGLILRQGEVLYNDPAKKLWSTIPNRDILALYPDCNMEAYDYNGITADDLVAKKAYDVLSFGPVLVKDGEITNQTVKISARQSDNPRSGIGLVSPGHYVGIVMEGKRRGFSTGCTVEEFAELFQAKGCQTAYNLDGGGTVSMMFMGEYVNRMGQFQANARKQIEALGLGVSEKVQKK